MGKSDNRGRPQIVISLSDDEILTGKVSDLAARVGVSATTIIRRRKEIKAYKRAASMMPRVRRVPVVDTPPVESAAAQPQTVQDFARDLLGEFTLTSEGATVPHGVYMRLVAVALGVVK